MKTPNSRLLTDAELRRPRETLKLLDAVRAKCAGVLEVQFAGTDSKGGAACATVPLLGNGWYVA